VLRRALAIALLILLAVAARADVVRVLDDDREAAQARVDLIRQARNRIEVLYFMAKDDRVALSILQLLRDARRRGVGDVRMVIDGSFRRIPKAVLSHLRDEGVLIRTYHPFDLRHPTWMLHRMHEKVIVVDGKCYITGGRNLAESYFGMGRKMNYRDIDIYVDGPSAADAERRFEEVWNSEDVAALHGHVTRRGKRQADHRINDAKKQRVARHRGKIVQPFGQRIDQIGRRNAADRRFGCARISADEDVGLSHGRTS